MVSLLTDALQALRAHCRGNLWCVFGCGGDRDQGKRPDDPTARGNELGGVGQVFHSDGSDLVGLLCLLVALLGAHATRDQYGRHLFGQSCLMARRLVEAGVRFVTVHYDCVDGYSWDSHRNSQSL